MLSSLGKLYLLNVVQLELDGDVLDLSLFAQLIQDPHQALLVHLRLASRVGYSTRILKNNFYQALLVHPHLASRVGFSTFKHRTTKISCSLILASPPLLVFFSASLQL